MTRKTVPTLLYQVRWMCHSSPILSRCKKNQADIITERLKNYSVAITGRVWGKSEGKMVRESYKERARVGVGGEQSGECVSECIKWQAFMWQWGEGESFRRGFLLRGDSLTSLYGHIQNVSSQTHKFTQKFANPQTQERIIKKSILVGAFSPSHYNKKQFVCCHNSQWRNS